MSEDESGVEKTHNGVKKEGNLDEIKDFAEEVGEAIEKSNVKEKTVKEYEEWMPEEKDGENEIKERTVESAVTPEKKLEKESEGTVKDIGKASEKITDAGEKIKNGETPDSELKDASRNFLKPFFSKIIGAFRSMEIIIYANLMLPLNAYYFDSEEVAVDMKEKKNGNYEMDVKVTEEDKKDILKDQISDENE